MPAAEMTTMTVTRMAEGPSQGALSSCLTPRQGTWSPSPHAVVSLSLEEASLALLHKEETKAQRRRGTHKVTSQEPQPCQTQVCVTPVQPLTYSARIPMHKTSPETVTQAPGPALFQVIYVLHTVKCNLHNCCVRSASLVLLHR